MKRGPYRMKDAAAPRPRRPRFEPKPKRWKELDDLRRDLARIREDLEKDGRLTSRDLHEGDQENE